MAIALLEGFDYYPATWNEPGFGRNTEWLGSDGTTRLEAGRFAPGLCLYCGYDSGGMLMTREIPPTDRIAMGFALRYGPLNTVSAYGKCLLSIRDINGNVQFRLGFDDLGVVRVDKAWEAPGHPENGGLNMDAPMATGVGRKILANTWHYLELEFLLHDSAGECRVYLDGQQIINLAGVDTKGQATATFNRICFQRGQTSGGGMYDWRIDDLYILYDEMVRWGEGRIHRLLPVADTADKDFTPLSGAQNFAMIDEAQIDGETTYNSSNTVGAKDLFTIDGIATTPTEIKGVGIILVARKQDSGTRSLQPLIKSGAVELGGIPTNLTLDYNIYRRFWLNDPDGDVEWTKEKVNAMLVGYELSA